MNQVKDLSKEVGGPKIARSVEPETAEAEATPGLSQARPAVPSNAAERFLEVSGQQSQAGLVYQPALVAQASVRFLERDHDVDEVRAVTVIAQEPDKRGMVDWDEHLAKPIDSDQLRQEPAGEPSYQDLVAPLNDKSLMSQLAKDFDDYLYRTSELELMINPTLELMAKPDELEAEFRERCLEEATRLRDEEAQELKQKFQKKVESLKDKISREERELAEDAADLSSRRMEEWVTHAENLLGFLGGSRSRRRVSTSMSKRRMTSKARADLEESEETIKQFQEDLEDLELDLADEMDELSEMWVEKAEALDTEVLTPRHKDIHIDLFGVLWLPCWLDASGQLRPAYDPELLDPA